MPPAPPVPGGRGGGTGVGTPGGPGGGWGTPGGPGRAGGTPGPGSPGAGSPGTWGGIGVAPPTRAGADTSATATTTRANRVGGRATQPRVSMDLRAACRVPSGVAPINPAGRRDATRRMRPAQ